MKEMHPTDEIVVRSARSPRYLLGIRRTGFALRCTWVQHSILDSRLSYLYLFVELEMPAGRESNVDLPERISLGDAAYVRPPA